MIGFVRGKLVSKAPPLLLLDVQGIGYEIEAPMTTFYNLPAIGETVMLSTHLLVREDGHILFGFSNDSDRSLFRSLIRVNGVGAKLALTILSGLNAEQFHRCINDSDTQALIRLPGVGKKTAERLIIEMRDRLPTLTQSDSSQGSSDALGIQANNPKQEALSALVTLGYKQQDASTMVRKIASPDHSCEQIIRLALQGAVK